MWFDKEIAKMKRVQFFCPTVYNVMRLKHKPKSDRLTGFLRTYIRNQEKTTIMHSNKHIALEAEAFYGPYALYTLCSKKHVTTSSMN